MTHEEEAEAKRKLTSSDKIQRAKQVKKEKDDADAAEATPVPAGKPHIKKTEGTTDQTGGEDGAAQR
eukprot:7808951-Lingulodinium_polyedra.AAC.1